MIGIKEERRKVEENVTIVGFEVVAPKSVVERWLSTTLDYIGRFIHNKVRGNVQSDGLTQRVTIEIARPLSPAEKFTIKLLIYSLGRMIYNTRGLTTAIERINTESDDLGVDDVW